MVEHQMIWNRLSYLDYANLKRFSNLKDETRLNQIFIKHFIPKFMFKFISSDKFVS